MVAISRRRSEILTFVRLYRTTKASSPAEIINTTTTKDKEEMVSSKLEAIPEYIVLGLGLGYEISEILEKTKGTVYVIDYDKSFYNRMVSYTKHDQHSFH